LQTDVPTTPARAPRRALVVALGVVAAVVALVVLLSAVDGGDAFSLADSDPAALSYLSIFLLIAGDAVIPIFPGETTLNAASTLAAQGTLELPLVIVAGALGAIVGDSALFWLARRSAHRVRPQLERAQANKNVATALEYLGENAKVLLVFGRYVPGLRFVINTTMGLSDRPYRSFLPWSAIGGALWSTYTCLLAYWIGSALQDYPLGSVIVSGAVTTLFIAIYFVRERRRRRAAADPA
jgi:membrane-associated protein